MGKKARLKKQERLNRSLEERQQVEDRRRQARRPLMHILKRVTLALIFTVVLLYVGQVVDHKITMIGNGNEVGQ